jgi:hypothetical protein
LFNHPAIVRDVATVTAVLDGRLPIPVYRRLSSLVPVAPRLSIDLTKKHHASHQINLFIDNFCPENGIMLSLHRSVSSPLGGRYWLPLRLNEGRLQCL